MANDLDALQAEIWAAETVMLLQENVVAPLLVHRDFEDEFATPGKIVHTRKPGEFEAVSKNKEDEITIQDATATDIPVAMNQHIEVSYLLHEEDKTKSFLDLRELYMRPMAIALARRIDRLTLGQVYFFLENSAGTLGGLDATNGPEYLVELKKVMNNNFVPMEGRNLIITSNTEAFLLQNATFHQADRLGDQGQALTMGTLGRKFGFQIFPAQNTPSVDAQTTDITTAVDEALGYPAGTTVLTVDGVSGDLYGDGTGGPWVTIGDVPYHVIDSALTTGDTTEITLEYGLREAVADDAVITKYPDVLVDNAAGYPADYRKTIIVDATVLQVGQLVTFGEPAGSADPEDPANVRYAIVKTNGTTTMELDKPLAFAITDDSKVNLGPSGDFNWALVRDACTLAIRPLSDADPAGASMATASFNGATVRITIARDHRLQATMVTGDFLAAIKPLDKPKGAVLLT
jgi:hypothetical protein